MASGLVLPPEVCAVVIASNPDAAGRSAARAAAARWRAEGRTVRITTPDTPGQDFNDMLRARMRGEASHMADGTIKPRPEFTKEDANAPGLTLADSPPHPAGLSRLAALYPLAYDRQRQAGADALGVRVSTVDAGIRARRPPPAACRCGIAQRHASAGGPVAVARGNWRAVGRSYSRHSPPCHSAARRGERGGIVGDAHLGCRPIPVFPSAWHH